MSLASSTRTACTVWPLMSMPRISCALACASSGPSASLTPPALPRPPALTWAFTTTRPPSSAAAARASSGVSTVIPRVTGTPCRAKSCLAWYSIRSIKEPSFGRSRIDDAEPVEEKHNEPTQFRLLGRLGGGPRYGPQSTLPPRTPMTDSLRDQRRRSTVAGDGVTLAAWAGSTDGPPVLFVHGYPDTHRVWDPVIDRLDDRFHCLSYDVRGAGESDAPTDRDAYRLTHLRSDLVAVMDALSPE